MIDCISTFKCYIKQTFKSGEFILLEHTDRTFWLVNINVLDLLYLTHTWSKIEIPFWQHHQ